MRTKATLYVLAVTAITTLHALAALWCYHHWLDNVLILILSIAVILSFVGQALHWGTVFTLWLNYMICPEHANDN